MDQSPGQTDLIDAEGKQEPAQDHRNTQGYERHRRLRLLQSERTIHRLIPALSAAGEANPIGLSLLQVDPDPVFVEFVVQDAV